jgi:hypothetical protein
MKSREKAECFDYEPFEMVTRKILIANSDKSKLQISRLYLAMGVVNIGEGIPKHLAHLLTGIYSSGLLGYR